MKTRVRKILILSGLIFLFLCVSALAANKKPLLSGIVVVLDAGHGGKDDGASGWFSNDGKKVRVVEDEYVMDVTLRVKRIVESYGGIVVMTTRDPLDKIRAYEPSDVFSPDDDELFALNGKQVVAGNKGLLTRILTANNTLYKYKGHKIAFISIHFDKVGRKNIEGIRIIVPKKGNIPPLANYLKNHFSKDGRIRTDGSGNPYPAVVKSGDKKHGIRNLFILRGEDHPYKYKVKTKAGKKKLKVWNSIKNRVLIELGNFANRDDVWRIRDYRVREKYAQLIVRALFDFNKQ